MKCSGTTVILLVWVSLVAGGITVLALAGLLWPGLVFLFNAYLYLVFLLEHCKYLFGLVSFFFRGIPISAKVHYAWMSRVTQRVYDVDSVYTDETHCEFWATVHYRLPRLSHTTKTTPVQGKQGHAMILNDVEEPTETRDSQAAGELTFTANV